MHTNYWMGPVSNNEEIPENLFPVHSYKKS
jgi:hypothetical protein